MTSTQPPPPAIALTDQQRLQAFGFGGLLLVLMNFSSPAGGMIDIPVSFFLKNRMHLHSNDMAVFKLWVALPLMFGFVFGFLRDRWSPFGGGDRAHLLVFGATTAMIYGGLALATPSYAGFLGGLLVATMAFRMVSSAAYGITNTLAQKHAVSGQMSSIISVGASLPDLISFILGGMLSQTIEGQGAAAAAAILFSCAAGLMLAIALLGVIGPKWIFEEARDSQTPAHPWHDLKRIARHWPIYPPMLIQLLWQFAPATGTVLQYHIVDHLHATDAQWGSWLGIFYGSFLPLFAAYGWISRRVRLRTLLWVGFGLAVFQMTPLLLVHEPVGALMAAVPMGILGSIGQGALVDLVIRSAPRGCQGMMMMLFFGVYFVSTRAGDLLGTWIYDYHGGFIPNVVITIIVYILILPLILLIPKHLTATKDGEALND